MSYILLRKMSFPLIKMQKKNGKGLLDRSGISYILWMLPFPSLGFCLVRAYIFWMYMCISSVIQRALLSWSHLLHLVCSENFSGFSSALIPEPSWKGLIKTILLGPALLSCLFCPLSSYVSLGYVPCSGKKKILSYSTDVYV